MHRTLKLSLLFTFLFCGIMLAAWLSYRAVSPGTPLKSEFYQSKRGEIYYKVWIEKESDIPFDNFTWKLTKVQAPDGQTFSFSYPMSKSRLLSGVMLNSHAMGGVNPYGSDCNSGDRFIIQIPKYPPLVIDVPDSAKGLKLLPYSH